MTEQQIDFRRESGMLVLGVLFGVLGGIITGLWAAYYVEWVKSISPDFNWLTTVIVASVVLIIVMVFLFWWSVKQIRESMVQPSPKIEECKSKIGKLHLRDGDKELDIENISSEDVNIILQSWKNNINPDTGKVAQKRAKEGSTKTIKETTIATQQ
jgi:hypothetical protein